MAVLTPQQRNTLEAVVKQARRMAEQGAYNALHSMAVDHTEPYAHMTAEQRSLRNSLRSKARLLGDDLLANGEQKIEHLSYELAYETWHKMLFAKFLEANGLLMHTDGVAVTMEDCEELAKEEGFFDKWDAAANYASKMLPAIFRTDDPLMQVAYATDERIKLETIIDGLENQIFVADDALGWVYQFWQSEAKAAINASGDKIDGEKLPAVTQLFTEPYMVHFLIDNTLGAWWVSRNPGIKPPIKFEYLRLLEDGTPAAGKFEGWPSKTAEVTALDPCMGSGHFVASLFPVFAALRMQEESLTKEQATDKVIAENLNGLELDARCTQIAAFNLALTAWKYCGYYKELPEMNLACSGIAPKGKVEDWVKLVGKVERADYKLRLENGMKMLYEHFQLAPELGSLLDPTTIKADAFTASFEELQPVLKKALENEADTEQLERGVMAAGIAKAGQLLAKKYTLQITNVPYLSKRKQDILMADYCEKRYKDSDGDLATVFYEKMLGGNNSGGTSCCVMPQNWLSLTSYKNLRKKLIEKKNWSFVARLGTKSFTTPMFDFNVVLISINNKSPKNKECEFFGIDVGDFSSADIKANKLLKENIISINQNDQLSNPDYRIILSTDFDKSELKLLSNYATCNVGLQVGDWMAYRRNIWEIPKISSDWRKLVNTVSESIFYHGCDDIVYWPNNGKMHDDNPSAYIKGKKVWGKKGVTISMMAALPASLYMGESFRNGISVIVPKKPEHLNAIWAYASSEKYNIDVRKIDQKLYVTTNTLVKVPFDLEHWQKVATEKFPNGLPKPYSDDPTQWLFHGHPIKTENPLLVALARVLSYRWPAETDTEMELANEARVLIEAVNAYDHLSDEDGIFCIPSVNAEQAGAERLRDYLQQVFAGEWNNQTITQLLQKEGAKSTNLEAWLRDEFFMQHCKVFQNRPFIWHIWDGRKDGFSALVNYHKLDKDNLSKLIYTYLNDWIRVCVTKKNAGESGAEGLLSAAQKLKENLEAILHGEAPYDIFVRWKPLEQQPIGWEPDLNDGVRLNIRPFVEAGVIRTKFNVKWGVDRGKNPPNSFWGEVRDNDKHLSLEEKRLAREKIKKI
ncbi:Eco57I restriction-modification methylase domain-containing protein [Sediminibacterium sp.]|uniref:Eco57I restriction-modification methylase domain-containing protein n=1 Tax=Sediminibacterium sp. TaxID=1917865 RepID=UPI003F6FD976